ncbi:MAG: FliM/FliN family flagellar motor C-terminal domain-containing protein [Paracoccaceae bacterium]
MDRDMAGQGAVIRRKVAAATPPAAEGSPGADRGWRLALARAARDVLKLGLEVRGLSLDRMSLAELLELPEERSLLAVVEGPDEGLGLMALSPPVLAAMVEVQTLGRVLPVPPAARRPTRTDAAMIAPAIDAALSGLEIALAEEADLIWAGGFRYASFLDDARPLGLLLDDTGYRVLRAEVSLAEGARTGGVLLALPAEGRGPRPARIAPPAADAGPAFARALAAQVADAGCVLQAVLARLSMPLSQVMALSAGEFLPLPAAALDRIGFEGVDARRLAEGKLGQNRGMRAVRLTPPVEVEAQGAAAPALRAVG